jgi:putative oxidoreductase
MFRPALNAPTTDFGLLLIRVIVGVVFVFHGAQKVLGAFGGVGMEKFTQGVAGMGLPYPEIAAQAAAWAEFGGGMLLILGLLTRVAAVPLAITMAIACIKVHNTAFSLQHSGMEYALTLGVVSLGLLFTGGGRYSIDGLIFQRWAERPQTIQPASRPPAQPA